MRNATLIKKFLESRGYRAEANRDGSVTFKVSELIGLGGMGEREVNVTTMRQAREWVGA